MSKTEQLKQGLWLFYMNLFISAFTFGGGYVVVPMVRKYYVEKKKFFSEEELMDIAAISQSAPGAIAINLTALAGYRVLGLMGAAVSCISAILPPLLILMAVSAWYSIFVTNPFVTAVLKGMQAGVAALMVDLIIDMVRFIARDGSRLLVLLIPAAFAANFFCQVNAAIVLAGCGMISLLRLWQLKRKRG